MLDDEVFLIIYWTLRTSKTNTYLFNILINTRVIYIYKVISQNLLFIKWKISQIWKIKAFV